MTSLPENPLSLVSEDARDTAVNRLQEVYAEGHISHEEMVERLHQVLTVTTHGELVSAMASLPEEKPATTSTIAVASGWIRRRGTWRVPRFLKVESAYGKLDLDLSRAVIEHPVVDIELQLPYGRAKITVPSDATVEIQNLRTEWKDPRYKPRRPSHPGGARIQISGVMGYGRLKIRHARR